jgi:hypothetical protein
MGVRCVGARRAAAVSNLALFSPISDSQAIGGLGVASPAPIKRSHSQKVNGSNARIVLLNNSRNVSQIS